VAQPKKIAEGDPAEVEVADPTDNNGAEALNGTDEQAASEKGKPKPPAASTSKKVIGSKEVPPFAWKVVGRSGNTVLVLFKAVESADAEAQLARLRSDKYYKDLRVVDIDAKIVQPPKPAKTRRSATKSSAKTAKAAASKSSKAKPAAKKKTTTAKKSAATKPRVKGGVKATIKVAKKKTKTTAPKSAKKKTARKK
jgi:hypothetical protein